MTGPHRRPFQELGKDAERTVLGDHRDGAGESEWWWRSVPWRKVRPRKAAPRDDEGLLHVGQTRKASPMWCHLSQE